MPAGLVSFRGQARRHTHVHDYQRGLSARERAGLRASACCRYPGSFMRVEEGSNTRPRGRGGPNRNECLYHSGTAWLSPFQSLRFGNKFPGTKILPMIGFATLIGTGGLLRRGRGRNYWGGGAAKSLTRSAQHVKVLGNFKIVAASDPCPAPAIGSCRKRSKGV